MKYGLKDAVIARMQAVFSAFPDVERVSIYGSRAKGNFKPGSDIDLTLHGKNLTTSQLRDIANALDDLLLPYMIDLSLFDQLDHAGLRGHIERVGLVLYQR